MEVRNLWPGDLNSVLSVPPLVRGQTLMWIAMSHCGAYEVSDATVECVSCVLLLLQVCGPFHTGCAGSFHTTIYMLFVKSIEVGWVGTS